MPSGTEVSVETWGAWNSVLRQQQWHTPPLLSVGATWGAGMPTMSSREDEPPTQVVAGASGESALPPVLLPAVGLEQIS